MVVPVPFVLLVPVSLVLILLVLVRLVLVSLALLLRELLPRVFRFLFRLVFRLRSLFLVLPGVVTGALLSEQGGEGIVQFRADWEKARAEVGTKA